MKDKYYNKWLNIKNHIRRVFNYKADDSPEFAPSVFHNFRNMTNEDFKSLYSKTQNWGMYHPEYLQMWYDEKCVNLTERGLELSVSYNRLPLSNGGSIPNGVGLVVSKDSYGYGIYEWEFRLPKGMGLWPALWLGANDKWPPEIDVLEGYSGVNGYGDRVETNVWLSDDEGGVYDLKAKRHGFVFNEDEFVRITLDYSKDYIKIYYNGYLVRRISDKDVMRHFADQKMVVIMNNGIRKDNILRPECPMIVKSFSYCKC